MKTYNNSSVFLLLIMAARLAFLKANSRLIAWILVDCLLSSLAAQIRANPTEQTIQGGSSTPTVTIIITSTTPVVVTATTALPAQYNTGANAQNIPSTDKGRETSLAVPNARGANMFFMAGLTWMNVGPIWKTKNPYDIVGIMDLYGLTIAFGWRVGIHSKFQIDSSLLFGPQNEFGYSIDYVVNLDAFTYSFVIPLDKEGRCEFRLSPSIGLAYIHTNYESNYYPYSIRASDGQFALAAGGGFGFTFHPSKRFMIDTGFRYMRIDATTYNWGHISARDTGAWTLSAGWKF